MFSCVEEMTYNLVECGNFILHKKRHLLQWRKLKTCTNFKNISNNYLNEFLGFI